MFLNDFRAFFGHDGKKPHRAAQKLRLPVTAHILENHAIHFVRQIFVFKRLLGHGGSFRHHTLHCVAVPLLRLCRRFRHDTGRPRRHKFLAARCANRNRRRAVVPRDDLYAILSAAKQARTFRRLFESHFISPQ